MNYIDMHCDTLMEAFFAGKEEIREFPKAMVDLDRLKKGACAAQFFAVFLPCDDIWEWYHKEPISDDAYMEALERIFHSTLEKWPELVAYAGNAADFEKNRAEGKISAFLTIEDGRAVDGKMERLEEFCNRGYRLISLTWNAHNCFGAPNSRDPKTMQEGLTPFGKEAVRRMNELGMLVDVSHLSDGGFYDVASVSKKPFVASHSNCRSICNHPRNLTDDMLKVLGEHGGVAGLNFGPEFVSSSPDEEASRISDMVLQIEHVIRFGGSDCAAIGTDFDGIEGTLEIGSADRMGRLFDALQKHGMGSDQIEKVAYRNALRVIQEVM